METRGEHDIRLKMGLKMLSGNAHSSEAAILPSAPWRLVWALGTMMDEKEGVLVEGLCGGRNLKFAEMKIGYTGNGDMTILPAEAYCDLNVTLAEGQTKEAVCEKIRSHLASHGFPDVGVWPV